MDRAMPEGWGDGSVIVGDMPPRPLAPNERVTVRASTSAAADPLPDTDSGQAAINVDVKSRLIDLNERVTAIKDELTDTRWGDDVEARLAKLEAQPPGDYNLGRDVVQRLTSRRLWVTVAGMALALGGAMHGNLHGWEFVSALIGAGGTYVVSESYVDGQSAKRGHAPAPAPAAPPAHAE